MNQPPPRRSWRRRSHTARALEIVRLTKRPKANSAGWLFAAGSARSSILRVKSTPPSGEATSPPSMAPGARSEAMGAETGATRQIAEGKDRNASVTAPSDPGSVLRPSSPPPKS